MTEEREAKQRRGLFRRLFGRGEEEPRPEGPAAEADSGDADRPAVDRGVAGGEAVPALIEVVEAPERQPEPEPEPSRVAPAAPEPAAEPTPPSGTTTEPASTPVVPEVDEPAGPGLMGRLRQRLSRTRQGFVHKVDRVLFGRKEIDAETLERLEEALVTADLGVHTSIRLIEGVRDKVDRKELTSPEALRQHLKRAVAEILVADEGHFELGADRPQVIMVVGVNGVGKTTTIGKIAAQFRERGNKVLLAAADTFRAAAIEQLEIWGERVGAPVIRHQHGSDPAAVAFDAVEAAKARGADLVIVDTAGRLHTKANLMEELKKVKRVIGKALTGAPHEVLLVLDATTGQNAINQAKIFHEAVGVDAIALTKLDGTAKGGVIVGICDELAIPVHFIGIGEKVEDLRPFDAPAFVEALFQRPEA